MLRRRLLMCSRRDRVYNGHTRAAIEVIVLETTARGWKRIVGIMPCVCLQILYRGKWWEKNSFARGLHEEVRNRKQYLNCKSRDRRRSSGQTINLGELYFYDGKPKLTSWGYGHLLEFLPFLLRGHSTPCLFIQVCKLLCVILSTTFLYLPI